MAFICEQIDENSAENWPAIWQQALHELKAPTVTRTRLQTIHSGVRALLDSPGDQNEALHSMNNGVLSSLHRDGPEVSANAR